MDTGQPERLLVDLSPPSPPDEAELRAWTSQQSVFISSTMDGMSDERAAVARAIEAVGASPVWFEAFGGMDDDVEDAYIGNVASSDIYVGILGPRYGRPHKETGYSATHAEYNEAVRRGLRIGVWAAKDSLDGPQRDFLEAVRVFRATGSYSSSGDLEEQVQRRLRVLAAESLSPWVKVGNVVFRATSVRDDGKHISLTGRVRDPSIAAAIEGRRPDGWNRASETRVTWPGGTSAVRIMSIATDIGASRVRTFTIATDRIENSNRSSLLDVAVGDRSPEDLTELAMRIVLLGEPNPLGPMSGMVRANNPLLAIETLGLSEDSVQQVAELLVTEELVGSGRADHVTAFRLGPKRQGSRPLVLGWLPRRRYTNVEPQERQIEGEVAILGILNSRN